MVIRVPAPIRTVLIVVAVAALGVAGTGDHVVRRGETLSSIARDHGTTVARLVEANGIRDRDLIVAGSRIRIAGEGRGDRGTSTTNYVVRRGDTLASIARAHRTSVATIVAANRIANPNLIIAGRTIEIPVSSAGGGPAPAPARSTGSSTSRPGERHTVTSGQSVGSIAASYGISPSDLAAWNGIVDGRIYASSSLVLYDPGPLPSLAGSGTTTTHTVGRGESLSSIAARYGTSIATIAGANDIRDPNRITVGQRLTITGSGGSVRCFVPGATFFNDWGFPRSGGRHHAGTDLFAPRGTPVVAPVSGTVTQTTGSVGGHQVRLIDPHGNLWFASHLDGFGAAGRVGAGEVIGTVGDSGNARGSRPHAHVEYHPAGHGAVNLYPVLRATC